MKIRRNLFLIVLTVSVAFNFSCRRDTVLPDNYSLMTFETQCLGSSMDGTLRLKAWGTGANRAAAIENAKRNALRDVLFKGIRSGSAECNQNPLIYEVNAQERYEDYFNAFFSEGGAYTRYAFLYDETLTSRTKAKGKTQQAYGVVVTVHRAELQQRLLNDGIITHK